MNDQAPRTRAFLPRDLDKALFAIKHELYDRLVNVDERIQEAYGTSLVFRLANERAWLLDLIDWLEKH
jgi:hypothetical protein